MYELDGSDAALVSTLEPAGGARCCTLGASPPGAASTALALGSQDGSLSTYDLSAGNSVPIWTTPPGGAHAGGVHAIDSLGGGRCPPGRGAPEILTGGEDGAARLWDPRAPAEPVLSFEGARDGGTTPAGTSSHGSGAGACWAVALGGAGDAAQRCVAAGYSTGDVRVWDVRSPQTPLISDHTPNGVCSLEWDRREVAPNKLVGCGLEGSLFAFDAKTLHPTRGAARAATLSPVACTLWGVRHAPQDRERFALLGGCGSVWLYRYSYPDKRSAVDPKDGKSYGIAGSCEYVAGHAVSSQPVVCFDWSPDKAGLAVCGCLDQCARVFAVTSFVA